MRQIIPEPELFRAKRLHHKQSRELAAIDRILVANPSAAEAVWKDLQGLLAKTGRPGLSADQVLRAAIIKQMTGYSYSDLCFHLADSETYRRFCGFASAEKVGACSQHQANHSRDVARDQPHTSELCKKGGY